ncbi:TRAP transporter, solute-binding component [Aeropyrum pernix K1]|uniref:TRAP transporter, solute-binding component n=1 Tax=Aeropyrum pernix (strain ATCC 700893 / DSM 11879 / JCM 9820 / NBRC 100138 / K1) TaxID=272557 RepID=Q9Y8T8_AERPE|nr:TRAP transporter substrate-binding protein [Aeropyrum pernix]BAA81562.2 TRAP transporter, solute-binding component [Aeropyrum pernix K1]
MAENRNLLIAVGAVVVVLIILVAGYMLLGGGEEQAPAATPTETQTGVGETTTSPEAEKLVIRWGTSRVGSSGYKALTTLAQVLNREIPEIEIVVEPQSGAIASMKGFAKGDLDGAYGADIAFKEMYTSTGRFEGFTADRLPVQTLWVFTIDIGLAVPKDRADEFKCWSDFDGKTIFTLPLGWDTGTALRNALDALGINYNHKELDLEAVATSLSRGDIVATGVYVTGERSVAPWIQNMLAQIDLVVVNPCPEEIDKLEQAGIPVARVSANTFPEPVGVDEFVGVRIFYGFHTGLNLSEDIVYKIIKTTYDNIDELASLDPAFSQLKEDFVGFQVQAIESLADLVPVHPGLAKFLKEMGAWKEEWKIAGS